MSDIRNLRVPTEDWEQWARDAESLGLSRSAYVRACVKGHTAVPTVIDPVPTKEEPKEPRTHNVPTEVVTQNVEFKKGSIVAKLPPGVSKASERPFRSFTKEQQLGKKK